MLDLDQLVSDLGAAGAEADALPAIKEVLDRTLAHRSEVAAALETDRAGIFPLHVSAELTVLNVVWAPHMTLYPHDHRMWAAIGIYGGAEDNAFYRRTPDGIVESGGKALRDGDVALLGSETIHAVTNPGSSHTGAIHVYGGDFFAQPRSEWDPVDLVERPFDVDAVLALFEAANTAPESSEA